MGSLLLGGESPNRSIGISVGAVTRLVVISSSGRQEVAGIGDFGTFTINHVGVLLIDKSE